MPQVLIQFDDPTVKAIDRIARAAKPKRAEFIRRAVKDEIFRLETERMREAYRLQPDSAEDADTWDLPEEWKERSSSRCGLAKALRRRLWRHPGGSKTIADQAGGRTGAGALG